MRLVGVCGLLVAVMAVPACATEATVEDAAVGDEAFSNASRMCGQDPFAADAVRGIDVSRHQGVVDFAAVAAANEVRLTETMFNVGTRKRVAQSIPGKGGLRLGARQ